MKKTLKSGIELNEADLHAFQDYCIIFLQKGKYKIDKHKVAKWFVRRCDLCWSKTNSKGMWYRRIGPHKWVVLDNNELAFDISSLLHPFGGEYATAVRILKEARGVRVKTLTPEEKGHRLIRPKLQWEGLARDAKLFTYYNSIEEGARNNTLFVAFCHAFRTYNVSVVEGQIFKIFLERCGDDFETEALRILENAKRNIAQLR